MKKIKIEELEEESFKILNRIGSLKYEHDDIKRKYEELFVKIIKINKNKPTKNTNTMREIMNNMIIEDLEKDFSKILNRIDSLKYEYDDIRKKYDELFVTLIKICQNQSREKKRREKNYEKN